MGGIDRRSNLGISRRRGSIGCGAKLADRAPPDEEKMFIDSAPIQVGSRVIERVLVYARITDERVLCVQLYVQGDEFG